MYLFAIANFYQVTKKGTENREQGIFRSLTLPRYAADFSLNSGLQAPPYAYTLKKLPVARCPFPFTDINLQN